MYRLLKIFKSLYFSQELIFSRRHFMNISKDLPMEFFFENQNLKKVRPECFTEVFQFQSALEFEPKAVETC